MRTLCTTRRGAVALVEVGAGADHEHALAAGRDDAAERADVAGERGCAEARHLGGGEDRRRLADELGGLAPAAAEGERDVVALDARDLGEVARGLLGDLERIGGGVVQRVGASCLT